jgi:hypothetical protein
MVGSSGAWAWLYGGGVGPFANNGDEYFLRNSVGRGDWWSLLNKAIDDDDTTGAYKMTGSDYVYPQVCFGGDKYSGEYSPWRFTVNSYYNFSLTPSIVEKITKVSVKADIDYPSSIYFDTFHQGNISEEIYINTYLQATINFKDGGSSDYSKLIARSYFDIPDAIAYWGTSVVNWKSAPATVERYYDGNTIELPINKENEDIQSIEVRIMSTGGQTGSDIWYFYSLNQVKLLKLYEINLYASVSKTIYDSTGTYATEIYDFNTEGDPGLVYLSTFTASVRNNYEENGTTVTFKIKTSSWSATLAGESWTDLNGDVNNGIQIPAALSPCRYVQVLSSFSTTMSSYTPVLQSMSVGALASSFTWTSAKFNANKVAGWKYAVFDDYKPSGTGISYAVRTATSSAGISSASWDWVESGSILDSGAHPSTHTWVQIKSTGTTTDGRHNPQIKSTTLLWYPESEPIDFVSGIVDGRYWLAVATTSTSYNDTVYVFDKNLAWTKFDGYTIADIMDWRGNTYVLDASTSAIWQADYGDADRYVSGASSSLIQAYWTSKAMFLDLDKETSLQYLYSSLKQSGGDIEIGHALYPDDFSYYTVDLSGSGVLNDRKAVNTGETGKIWQFKVQDNSSDDAFEFYNLTIYFEPKILR